MTTDSISFWDFSLLLYQQEKVEAACLSLQDDYGLDVNLVLFCFWFGLFKGELSAAALAPVQQYSHHWQLQVVQPLREVRRNLKKRQSTAGPDTESAISQLRAGIKANELNAEKLQQEQMEKLLTELKFSSLECVSAGVSNCEHNIQLILANRDKQANQAMQQQINLIMTALELVYPGIKDRTQ